MDNGVGLPSASQFFYDKFFDVCNVNMILKPDQHALSHAHPFRRESSRETWEIFAVRQNYKAWHICPADVLTLTGWENLNHTPNADSPRDPRYRILFDPLSALYTSCNCVRNWLLDYSPKSINLVDKIHNLQPFS